MLTADQYDHLVAPIAEGRVQQTQGQSHVEQWDVRRHLIRIFGFGGFDVETMSCEQVKEIEYAPGTTTVSRWVSGNRTQIPNEETRWTVVYRAQVRLIIKDHQGREVARYEDGATGDSCNQTSIGDAHDQAMKTALSQALKRCAVNLGDQFGLSLYNNGRTAPVVLRTLGAPERPHPTPPVIHNDEPVQPEPTPATPDPAPAAPTAIQPGEEQPAETPDAAETRPMADYQRRAIFGAFDKLGQTDPTVQREFIDWALGQPRGTCTSRGDLTYQQAQQVARALTERVNARR